MSMASELDTGLAHQHFSAACFNRAWELLDKPSRSSHGDQEMVLAALASL